MLKGKVFLIFCVILIATRLSFVFLNKSYAKPAYEDYERPAISFLNGNGFQSDIKNYFFKGWAPTAMQLPIYILITAASYKAFGVSSVEAHMALLIINILFDILSLIFLLKILNNFNYDVRSKYVCAFLFSINPILTITSANFNDTSIFILFMLWIFYYYLKIVDKPNIFKFLTLGVLWGVTCLINNHFLLFSVFGFLPYIKRHKINFKNILNIGLSGLICILILSGWVYRNYKEFGKFIPFKSGYSAVLFLGVNEFSGGEQNKLLTSNFNNQDLLNKYPSIKKLKFEGHQDELKFNDAFSEASRKALENREWEVVKLFFIKTWKMWTYPSSHAFLNKRIGIIFKVYFLVRFLVFLIGLFYLEKSSLKNLIYLMVLCVTATFSLTSVGMFRFIAYYEPLYVILLSLIMCKFLNRNQIVDNSKKAKGISL